MTPVSIEDGWNFHGGGFAWPGLVLAVALAMIAWWLYKRQIRRATAWRRRLLPLLRAAAVFLIASMIAQPGLDWQHSLERRGRVTIVTDTSPSMQIADEQMPTGQKLLIARSLALADVSAMDFTLADAAAALATGDDPTAVAEALTLADAEMFIPQQRRGFATLHRWELIAGHELSPFDDGELSLETVNTTRSVASLQLPRDTGDNFAERITGHLHPPTTGVYAFHLAADARAELQIDLGKGLTSIIRTNESTLPDDFDTFISGQISLDAGRSYRFELRHKDNTADDHLTLAWSTGGQLPDVIEGDVLSPPTETISPSAAQEAMVNALLRDAPRATIDRDAWAARLREQFEHFADTQVRGDASLQHAVAAFDSMPRSMRVARLLQVIEDPIREYADVLVVDASVDGATDLHSSLTKTAADDVPQAIIMLTDGRHTAGTDMKAIGDTAESLGRAGVPIYAAAIGSTQLPRDLIITHVSGPAEVHREDHISGHVTLLDTVSPDQPLVIRAMTTRVHGDVELWRAELVTTGQGRREIEFDFEIDEVSDRPSASSLRNDELLAIRFEVEVVEDELRHDNNSALLPIRVTQHARRILLLDGRPRWESRYIETIFSRQSRFDVTAVVSLPESDRISVGADGFPSRREDLFAYDAIILGEIPRSAWTSEQLQWLADFINVRGGGLIAIDGLRGHWAGYRNTPLATLLPVERGNGEPTSAGEFQLTAAGRIAETLHLEPDADRNAALWPTLPAPRWALDAQQRPGVAEVLLELTTERGDTRPAVVTARVGRGRIAYVGFDESWRWRKDAENRWQSRFWSGLVNAVLEPTFSGEDAHAAIGLDTAAVEAGESFSVRARIKDESGAFQSGDMITNARITATLLRDGLPVATAPLVPDAAGGGLLRGAFEAPSDPGLYEIAVFQAGIAESEQTARASVLLREPSISAELARLDADVEMLQLLADASDGLLIREEDAISLASRFQSFTTRTERRGRYDLWTSWPLFVSAAGLLCLEWFLRRRGGMI